MENYCVTTSNFYLSFIQVVLKRKFRCTLLELVPITFSEKYWSPCSTVIPATFWNLPASSATLPNTKNWITIIADISGWNPEVKSNVKIKHKIFWSSKLLRMQFLPANPKSHIFYPYQGHLFCHLKNTWLWEQGSVQMGLIAKCSIGIYSGKIRKLTTAN